eukprot:6737130-Pyramimonas_sp.AAC.2
MLIINVRAPSPSSRVDLFESVERGRRRFAWWAHVVLATHEDHRGWLKLGQVSVDLAEHVLAGVTRDADVVGAGESGASGRRRP